MIYVVYLDKQVVGHDTIEEEIEIDDAASEEQIREECSECLDTMISNHLDTGWHRKIERKAGPKR